MQIGKVAEYVWSNSQEIAFGEGNSWDPNLFTDKWIKGKQFESTWKTAGAGWYWFLINMNYDELHEIEKPSTLPDNGCNIGLLTHDNRRVFGKSLLCASVSGMTLDTAVDAAPLAGDPCGQWVCARNRRSPDG